MGYPNFAPGVEVTSEKISEIFDLLEGYSDGKQTINYR